MSNLQSRNETHSRILVPADGDKVGTIYRSQRHGRMVPDIIESNGDFLAYCMTRIQTRDFCREHFQGRFSLTGDRGGGPVTFPGATLPPRLGI